MTPMRRTISHGVAGAALVLSALALILAGCSADKAAAPSTAKSSSAQPAAQQPQVAPPVALATPAASAPAQEQSQASAQLGPSSSGEVTLKAADANGNPIELNLKTVHFDFDKYTIRPEDRPAIAYDAAQLKRASDVRVVIEGNCDERGSTEYNLALGEHRAVAVSKALQAEGIRASHLKTVSYGKERPVDPGHNEQAWAKNRRSVLHNSSPG